MTKKRSSEIFATWLTFVGPLQKMFLERAAFGDAAPGGTCARYATVFIYQTLPCFASSCLLLLCLAKVCLTMNGLAMSFHVLLCHINAYVLLPSLALPYCALTCCALIN